MKSNLKITKNLLTHIRTDLIRKHAFAHERVGFITAGCTWEKGGKLSLFCRDYTAVADDDYIKDHRAGAVISSEAIRKGLQHAYKNQSALLHIHTHGGHGRPEFSGIDVRSSQEFVPSFFNAMPKVPHGIIVLSNNSARGLIWHSKEDAPTYIDGFIQVGAPYIKFGKG